jgi:hypothetical protein
VILGAVPPPLELLPLLLVLLPLLLVLLVLLLPLLLVLLPLLPLLVLLPLLLVLLVVLSLAGLPPPPPHAVISAVPLSSNVTRIWRGIRDVVTRVLFMVRFITGVSIFGRSIHHNGAAFRDLRQTHMFIGNWNTYDSDVKARIVNGLTLPALASRSCDMLSPSFLYLLCGHVVADRATAPCKLASCAGL